MNNVSATNQPGPLDDLPPGVPLGQMWDVVNGKLDAKDVTQDPNIEPELQLAARKAEAGGAETGSADNLAGPAPQTPVSPDSAGLDSVSPLMDGKNPALGLGDTKPQIKAPNAEPQAGSDAQSNGYSTDQQDNAGKQSQSCKYLTADQAGTSGMGQKFCSEEDAVLAFFKEAEARTQADPKGVKPEYGADIAKFKDDEEVPYYIYNSVERSKSMSKEHRAMVDIFTSQYTVALAHTHPPEPRQSSMTPDPNRQNRKLSGSSTEEKADGDMLMMRNAQAKVDEYELHGKGFKITAYLARPDGHIHKITHPWTGIGSRVFPGFRLRYSAKRQLF